LLLCISPFSSFFSPIENVFVPLAHLYFSTLCVTKALQNAKKNQGCKKTHTLDCGIQLPIFERPLIPLSFTRSE
jgi:hypothetical protein